MTGRKSFYVFGSIAIALVVANGIVTAVQGEQQELSAEEGQTVDFKDKVVVLEISGGNGLNSESDSVVLEKARVLRMGNRDFIVGEAVSLQGDEDDWYKEISFGAPCDNVVNFRTMTPDRFKTYAKKWKEQAEE